MFEKSKGAARFRTRVISLMRSRLIAGLFVLASASQASTFTNFQTIWPFAATNSTGDPNAAVMEGSDGMLYGTTYGIPGIDYGGVFRIGKDGSHFQVLHLFAPSEGYNPSAPLIEATNGVLYGTTTVDSTNNFGGTIFKINKDGSGFAVLHYFTFATNDGGNPFSGLLQASDGELYGTAQAGGTAPFGGDGVIFRMDLSGSNFIVLHSFTGNDGVSPESALIEGTNGVLYGTAFDGGTNGDGTVFRIDKSGSNFAVIHYFTGGANDGFAPFAKLFKGPNGKLYGTTESGGLYNSINTGGVAFSMDYNGSNYTVLHNFGSAGDGSTPYSDIVQGPDGLLYSTTFGGNGAAVSGTVFTMNTDGSGYSVVVSFANTNGANPNPLIVGSDGALYGTTQFRGPGGDGTVFKLTGILPDVLAAPFHLGNGWRVSGHGAANVSYTLLYATNLSTPSSNWTVLGTVSTDSSGNWQYNDLTNTPRRFYQTSYP